MVCDRRKGHDEIKKGNGKENIYKILMAPSDRSCHS